MSADDEFLIVVLLFEAIRRMAFHVSVVGQGEKDGQRNAKECLVDKALEHERASYRKIVDHIDELKHTWKKVSIASGGLCRRQNALCSPNRIVSTIDWSSVPSSL